MKTLLASITLLIVATSQAFGAVEPLDDPSAEVHLCWKLGDFTDANVQAHFPAQCTCDGLKYISVPGMTLGGSAPGNNGGIVPDCYLHTIVTPGFYTAAPDGSLNVVAIQEPIIIEMRGCDTSGCYWLFGSADCVIESTHQGGSRVSYRVVGPCARTIE